MGITLRKIKLLNEALKENKTTTNPLQQATLKKNIEELMQKIQK